MKNFCRRMPTLFTALLWASLLLARPAAAETAPPPPDRLCVGGMITGTVKDGSGTGIYNVTVTAEEEFTETSASVTTGFDGQYDLCLPPGRYGVSFSAPGFLKKVYNNRQWGCGDVVTVTAGGSVPNVNAVLLTGGAISGTVTDGTNPLDGVLIGVRGNDVDHVMTTATDINGEYLVAGLPTGSYRVSFRTVAALAGYESEYYDDRAMETEADAVAVTAPNTVAGIDAVLVPGGSISGTVTAGAAPRSNIDVTAVLPNGAVAAWDSTDAAGAYTLTGLKSGPYRVHFEDTQDIGLVDEWYPGTVGVTAPGDAPGIDVALEQGGSISGTVTWGGSPSPNRNIDVIDSRGVVLRSANTDPLGRYSAVGLPSGSYRVVVWGVPTYRNVWYDGRQSPADAGTVAVTAPGDTAGIDFQLQAVVAGSVSGRISFTGPACGAGEVWLYPPDPLDGEWYYDYGSVGPTGTWRVENMAPGSYRARAFGGEGGPLQDSWYGNTPAIARSKTLQIKPSMETTGINIKVPSEQTLPVAEVVVGDARHIDFMGPGEQEPLVLNLDCNKGRGYPVDWWLLAFTPLPPPKNVYHFEPAAGWVEGMDVSLQGPCMPLKDFKVTTLPYVPLGGDVDIYFGVDGDMNGRLDPPFLFYNGTRVHMYR